MPKWSSNRVLFTNYVIKLYSKLWSAVSVIFIMNLLTYPSAVYRGLCVSIQSFLCCFSLSLKYICLKLRSIVSGLLAFFPLLSNLVYRKNIFFYVFHFIRGTFIYLMYVSVSDYINRELNLVVSYFNRCMFVHELDFQGIFLLWNDSMSTT